MKIGLVCEGGSDHALLSKLFSHIKTPAGDSVEIVPIQPVVDATTNKAGCGGWTEIRKWCVKHSNKKGKLESADALERRSAKFYWKSLLPLSPNSSLMIQIDTDIAHNINNLPKSLYGDFGGDRKSVV